MLVRPFRTLILKQDKAAGAEECLVSSCLSFTGESFAFFSPPTLLQHTVHNVLDFILARLHLRKVLTFTSGKGIKRRPRKVTY